MKHTDNRLDAVTKLGELKPNDWFEESLGSFAQPIPCVRIRHDIGEPEIKCWAFPPDNDAFPFERGPELEVRRIDVSFQIDYYTGGEQ